MNLPNRLSILRIALIPFIVLFLYPNIPWTQLVAFLLFIGACFTDWLDGYIARKHNIVTNFGKFLDPVADKLLVLSTMIALSGQGIFPAWACIVVLFRELAVDGLRLVAVEQGRIIAAGPLGKIKTMLQMLMLMLYMMRGWLPIVYSFSLVFLWASIAMTLWSGLDYFIRNRGVLVDNGKRDV